MPLLVTKIGVDMQTFEENNLVSWVVGKTENWRNHRDSNYLSNWQKYERLWRGIWDADDRQRESERSRIITPALQQAIEGHTAEITEAVFGTGSYFFDISDDMLDEDPMDVEYIKNYMHECFKKNKVNKAVSDIILLGSIYGTGIGEIIVEEKLEITPATQEMPETGATVLGTEEQVKLAVSLRTINPKNFLIDPTAQSIDDALGCAIEEYVSAHKVAKGIADGIYLKKTVGTDSGESQLEVTQESSNPDEDRVKLIRYYGLVPRHLLNKEDKEETVELFPSTQADLLEDGSVADEYGDLVEAIIVIANDSVLLKAEVSPYMMKDRPIVAYQDDSMPNRFWGRGIAEKGFNMQMALDAQMRSHLDSLALTTVPMMAMDATRMPRGFRFEVRPGKTMLTNGNPNEILSPMKFGSTDPGNMQMAQAFQQMLLQATGTIDSAGMVGQTVQGEAGLSGMSLALSGLIKKNKRTLMNFQEQFLIPFVEKAAWRFMQFSPDSFPTKDWKFIPASTMGMMAREVEQQQFINLLKTLGPDTPIMPIIMAGIVGNSSLSNRNQLLQALQQMTQPNPQQQQMQQVQMQLAFQKAQVDIGEVQSRIALNQAKAQNTSTETQFIPAEVQAKLTAAASNNLDEGNADFERRLKLADIALREKDIDTNVEITRMQMENKNNLTNN
jgi:hypothetical protein